MGEMSSPRRFGAASIVALMALAACRESGGADEFYEISGKLFVFNYRLATATYLVTLQPLKPQSEDRFAVASFENPAGGDPIVVKEKIWPKLDKVTIESPPLECVVKEKPYKVSIRIEQVDGTLMQALDTTITSSQDQSILPDRALVVGPAYERNKDLLPNGRLANGEKPACPSTAPKSG